MECKVWKKKKTPTTKKLKPVSQNTGEGSGGSAGRWKPAGAGVPGHLEKKGCRAP